MVMETPSPQCVGREFVRQYYTLLHEAPMHLHRFYSHNSCFVHGGIEKPGEEQPPVMGQQDIHKKIMSLNFRDCHAKIRQVDSQATVGNAVVVQVTGELSNNGEPMRRFMQTFVLAPQSPKKYYVHNDIFRYQDEVFHDEENDDSTEDLIVDSEPENLDDSVTEEPTVETTECFEPSPVISNGTSHFDEVVIEDTTQKQEESEQDEPVDEVEEEPEEPLVEEEDSQTIDTGITDEQTMTDYGMGKKPWSAIISGSGASSTQTSQTIKPSPPKPEVKAESVSPQPQRGPRPREPFNMNRDSRERNSLSRGEGDESADGFTNRRSRYPDSHQLFVGNLPHNISEDELRKFFSEYGNVQEMRINRGSSGQKVHVPNFGFVIFDSPDPVQSILKQKPIKYNGEYRLNVEEKKARGDGSRMGGRGGPIRSGSGGPGNRGGFGTGRGMGMRGGFGRGDNRGPPGGGGNRGGFSGRR